MTADTPKPRRLVQAFAAIAASAAALASASCSLDRITSVEPTGEPGTSFPRVTARNLLDEQVTLPDDLAGNPALIHIAFYQRQQLEVNTWLDRADEITDAVPGIRIIETPTVGSQWALVAGWIDGGMRSGIPGDEARARTITLYTDTRKFRDALAVETDKQIYTVLIDDAGKILLIEPGRASDEAIQRVIEAAGG